MRTMAVLAAALMLTACAPKQYVIQNQFDQQSALAALKPGNNTIKGSALLRQNGGGTVTCAGTRVDLTPVNAYSTERVMAIYGDPERGFYRTPFFPPRDVFANDDPAYREAIKSTQCDAQGFFRFENIADGAFYVTTAVIWNVRTYTSEGGFLMRRVTVKGGNTSEVVLSQ